MKIYKIVAIIMLMTLFIGCCPKVEPEIRTVYKTKEVKVPVKCEVPKVICDFSGEGFTPTIKLLECIKEQKEIIKRCSE